MVFGKPFSSDEAGGRRPGWFSFVRSGGHGGPPTGGPDGSQRWPHDKFFEREREIQASGGAVCTPGSSGGVPGRVDSDAARSSADDDCCDADECDRNEQRGMEQIALVNGEQVQRTFPLVLLADTTQDDVLDLEAEQLERKRRGLQWAFVTTTIDEYLKAYKIAEDYQEIVNKKQGGEQEAGAATSSGDAPACARGPPRGSGQGSLKKKEAAEALFSRADELAASVAVEVSSDDAAVLTVSPPAPARGRKRPRGGDGSNRRGGASSLSRRKRDGEVAEEVPSSSSLTVLHLGARRRRRATTVKAAAETAGGHGLKIGWPWSQDGPGCTGSHGLKMFRTPVQGWWCSVCGQAHPKNSTFYGCRLCNHDECEQCVAAPRRAKHGRAAPVAAAGCAPVAGASSRAPSPVWSPSLLEKSPCTPPDAGGARA